jgi:hypothetical protein
MVVRNTDEQPYLGGEELLEPEEQQLLVEEEFEEGYEERVIREVADKVNDEELRELVGRVLTPMINMEDSMRRIDLDWTLILKNLLHIPEDKISSIVDAYMEWKVEMFRQFNPDLDRLIQTVKGMVEDTHKKYVWRIVATWQDVEPFIEADKHINEIEVLSTMLDSIPVVSIRAVMDAYTEAT